MMACFILESNRRFELSSRRQIQKTFRQNRPGHRSTRTVSFGNEEQSYLAIEQIRIRPRLSIALCVDADVMQAEVPVKILQPLIENAVKHGVSRVPGEGRITIRGYRDRDRLRVFVRNTGEEHGTSGASETGVTEIGLSNTRQRLNTLYGSDFTLSLYWPRDGGCQVSLDLPYRRTVREGSTLCEC